LEAKKIRGDFEAFGEKREVVNSGIKDVFIDRYGFDAWLVELATGFPAELLLAQSALETGWGRYVEGHNLFGIKDVPWDPGAVESETTEYIEGAASRIKAQFEDFKSPLHAMLVYVALLRHSDRYKEAWKKALEKDIEGFCEAIQKAGYATDPKYAKKLYAVYRSLPRDWRMKIFRNI